MRSNVRFALLAPLVGAILAFAAPAAQASLGVEKFFAGNCKAGATNEKCGGEELTLLPPPFVSYVIPKEPNLTETEEKGFTQAAGRVPNGVTDFKVNTTGTYPDAAPELSGGPVNHVRVDVAAGLATAPAAVPTCTPAEFGAEKEALKPGSGLYNAPECKPETIIGKEQVTLYTGPPSPTNPFSDLPVEGKVYNLLQPEATAEHPALASYYGVAIELPIPVTEAKLKASFEKEPLPGTEPTKKATEEFLEKQQYYVHSFVKGSVEWGKEVKGTEKGDYHDYFEVEVSTALPLISSRQVLYGTSGRGDFITNGTSCPGDHTTYVTLTNVAGETVRKPYETLIGLSGCNLVSFLPTTALLPETTQQDQPDGVTTDLAVPHNPAGAIDSSQLSASTFVLPEGMTLNPSAAAGLEACTEAQARIHSPVFGVACPEKSKIGTVSLNVPTLPEAPGGTLTGNIYLGGEGEGASLTKPPFTVYVNAESTRYGVDVRLKALATPDETTGRVTITFTEAPEQPFSDIKLALTKGALAPVANPLTCGPATTQASFAQFANPTVLASPPIAPFTVDSNNAGGACASPVPFSLTQSTANQTAVPAANTSFTFSLVRPDGQQYLSQVKTTLPEGLVGKIPAAEQCSEAAANSETVACPEGSKLGTAVVEAGSGATPFKFTGQVYLTGPYNGAPFGMSIKVPAIAGPFNFGTQVTRATLNIDQYTGRVTVTSVLPTIRRGVPLRIRQIVVAVTKQGFLINPTNCSVLQTESAISGFTPGTGGTASASLSSPFQITGCGGLAFKPSFKSKTSAKTSKANGASLETTLNIGAGQTNFKSVMVQLPKQLPSRLTTLQKACPEAVFNANPFHCPSGSFVGGARANTPTLPGKLQGPAILVSHAGLAFPDLDLVMEANGVKVILVGNTKISKGITTTTFASPPDVPVSSITVNLPIGGHSAVTANGSLCISPLTMPTTMIGQNGFKVTQQTKITVVGCGVRIAGQKTVGNTAYITVQTYSAGRISGSGSNLKTVYRKLSKAQKTATLKVPLSNGGARRGKPLKVKLRVGFVPKTKSNGNSASTTTVVFR
jgi:hypothetical protein